MLWVLIPEAEGLDSAEKATDPPLRRSPASDFEVDVKAYRTIGAAGLLVACVSGCSVVLYIPDCSTLQQPPATVNADRISPGATLVLAVAQFEPPAVLDDRLPVPAELRRLQQQGSGGPVGVAGIAVMGALYAFRL
jgi:hypothetical protein